MKAPFLFMNYALPLAISRNFRKSPRIGRVGRTIFVWARSLHQIGMPAESLLAWRGRSAASSFGGARQYGLIRNAELNPGTALDDIPLPPHACGAADPRNGARKPSRRRVFVCRGKAIGEPDGVSCTSAAATRCGSLSKTQLRQVSPHSAPTRHSALA